MLNQAAIDALRHAPVPPQAHFIGGKWTPALDGGLLDVVSPIDGRVLTQIANGCAGDVDAAVSTARVAFEDGRWSRIAPAQRKKLLMRLGDLIEANALDLSVLGVRDNGTEISMAFKAEALSAAGTFRYYAEALDKVYGEIAPTADNVLGLVHKADLTCQTTRQCSRTPRRVWQASTKSTSSGSCMR